MNMMTRIGHLSNGNSALFEEYVKAPQSEGSPPSFEELFVEFYPLVYGIGLKFTGRREDAEDITQEVFTKVWKNLDAFNHDSSFKTWIYRITINACIDYSRKPWQRFGPMVFGFEDPQNGGEEVGLASREETAEQKLLDQESAKEVRRAIAKLKPHLKSVLLLKDLEEMSYEEISTVLGLSLGTISSRLNRARKALQSLLESSRPALSEGS